MSANLRISIISETWFPQVNGVSRTLDRLAGYLAEQGDRVQLLIPRYQQPGPALPAAMSLARLEQDKKTGALEVADYNPISFSGVNGGWIHCGSTLSTWNTHLGSEEYEPDAKANPYHYGLVPEGRVYREGICSEVRGTQGLGGKPLAVVSAGQDLLPGARELQSELATLSSNSFHLSVEAADHVTLVTHRDHALRVAVAIRQLINRSPAASPFC